MPISLMIDLRVLKYRKYLLSYSALIQGLCMLVCCLRLNDNPYTFYTTMYIECAVGLVFGAVKDTIWIEQARNDITYGFGDLGIVL